MAQPNRNEGRITEAMNKGKFIYEAKLMWKQDVHYENMLSSKVVP